MSVPLLTREITMNEEQFWTVDTHVARPCDTSEDAVQIVEGHFKVVHAHQPFSCKHTCIFHIIVC